MQPRVSVVMPVYDGERHLREAIDSVLRQSYRDFELLVIDDGSSDGSRRVVQGYRDRRLRLLTNDPHRGLVETRNRGVEEARGEYLAWLDCDDLAVRGRLKAQVEYLDAHPEIGVLGAATATIDVEGRPTGTVYRYPLSPEAIPSVLLFHNFFAQSAVTIRRSALGEERYRNYPGAEDYDLWVRLARKTRLWNLGRVLAKYRIHEKSITFARAVEIEGYVRQIAGEQLLLLGVVASAEEMEIHRALCAPTVARTPGDIGKAEAWLLKLKEANERTRSFPSSHFERCLREVWFGVCRFSVDNGWTNWHLYRRSPLKKPAGTDLLRTGRFLARCLLGRGGRPGTRE